MKTTCRLILISFIVFLLCACENSKGQSKEQSKKPENQLGKTLVEVQSPDKRRTAKIVLREGLFYFIVDGIESDGFKNIGVDPPVFSPDSKHIAYVIKRDNKAAVVLDGKESGYFLDISAATVYRKSKDSKDQMPKTPSMEEWSLGKKGLVFSPDSSRLAFCTWISDKKMVVVVDGKKGPVFEAISAFGVLFSPDSRNIAYVARKLDKWHVIVNDKISEGYEAIGNRGLKFTPGWDQVTFRAKKGEWKTIEWQFKKN